MPSLTLFTDVSGLGMGGFNLETSRSWNFLFPIDILKFTTINYLKFLAVITQLLILEAENNLTIEHILIWIENMMAVA